MLPTNAHGLRVLRAPGFPCSLRFSRDMFLKSSGKIMSRECGVTAAAALPTVVAREGGRSVRRGFSARALTSLEYWIARRSLSSGGHSADPLAGDDDCGLFDN